MSRSLARSDVRRVIVQCRHAQQSTFSPIELVPAFFGYWFTSPRREDATADLRRLRLKGVIHRIPKTHRYTATSYGLKVVFFYSKLYLRILRPAWHALLPDSDRLPRPLRAALDQLDTEIHKLHQEAVLAA